MQRLGGTIPKSLLQRARSLKISTKPAETGSIDHTFNGLIAGWLICPTCPEQNPAPIKASIGQHAIESDPQKTPRPDIPTQHGLVWRFDPLPITEATDVVITCSQHPETQITRELSHEHATLTAIARIEHSYWPTISGWVAFLKNPGTALELEIEGHPPIPVPLNLDRPDVKAFLGTRGVHGFHLDVGAITGFAVPDNTPFTITSNHQELARSQFDQSPLTDNDTCPDIKEINSPSPSASPSEIEWLNSRLNGQSAIPENLSWKEILRLSGMEANSDITDQWARYLAHQGLSNQEIADRITLKQANAWGVPHLDPRLTEPTQEAKPQQKTPADVKVCVAGLVNHKSGLGQNARNSIAALKLTGVHTCSESFFPQLGSWNPRLTAHHDSVDRMKDHTVLLHLPLDKVVSSLAIQPALLASPRLIGYFMWETEVIPREFYRALNTVEEIWTATEFVANAFRAVTNTPIFVTGHAVDVSSVEEFPRSELGVPEENFLVHFSFDANSTIARKNPNAVIDAFHLAFDHAPTASLVLRIRNRQQLDSLARQGDPNAQRLLDRLASDPSIIVISGELTYGRALGIIQQADCYLSLHRSEGFGYTIAEAQLLGTPVIATEYSGSGEIMDPNLSTAIKSDLVDIRPGEYFYWEPASHWADPDLKSAADALRSVRSGNNPKQPPAERSEIDFSITQLAAKYSDRLLNNTIVYLS